MSFTSFLVRKMFGAGDKKRDAGLFTPGDIERFDNISYGESDKEYQLLDVYRPKGAEGKLPAIINVHGGGWVYGSKDTYQFYCMSLAQRGFAVVNFSYRLAPEYKYPASFEDTAAVCNWILQNSDKYGLDTANIFGVGDSAGAHMLSLFSAALTNEEFAKRCGYSIPEHFRFNAVALNCGAYKIHPEKKNDLTTRLMNDFLKGKGTEEEYDLISVLGKITSSFPPSYVMSCPGDFLLPQAEPMAEELEKAGVEHQLHIYGVEENKLVHVFHVDIRRSEAELCNDNECNFFREHIRN